MLLELATIRSVPLSLLGGALLSVAGFGASAPADTGSGADTFRSAQIGGLSALLADDLLGADGFAGPLADLAPSLRDAIGRNPLFAIDPTLVIVGLPAYLGGTDLGAPARAVGPIRYEIGTNAAAGTVASAIRDAGIVATGSYYAPRRAAGVMPYGARSVTIEVAASAGALGLTGDSTKTFRTVACAVISPLVIPFGNGILAASGGDPFPHLGIKGERLAFFDLDGDGFVEFCEWVGPEDGLLIWDGRRFEAAAPGEDGHLPTPDGRDLIGTAGGFRDGFAKLGAIMGCAAGDTISAADADVSGVRLWFDEDGDARLDPGELKGLEESGVGSLGLPERGAPPIGTAYVGSGPNDLPLYDWWPSYLEVDEVPAEESGS